MNANELADKLSSWEGYYGYCDQAATTLRQQQAEIEKLEKLMNFWKESYNELRTRNEQ